jgi:FkbM family methyltransferase
VDAHRLAPGSAEGAAPINVCKNADFSSLLLTPNTYALGEFGDGPAVVAQELVDVRRPDDMWPSMLEGAYSVYLKMDTQGWDGEVLEGASGVLDQVAALQTEVSVKVIYDGVPPWTESLQRLERWATSCGGCFPSLSTDAYELSSSTA